LGFLNAFSGGVDPDPPHRNIIALVEAVEQEGNEGARNKEGQTIRTILF